ncbi:MAG: hypothetical protein QGI83_06975 [Candidatus Latescibacteria bacterium]|jgi:hypothetical protein|nr:hypothetical protein [Candidatus Latescibacterota bacterium]
MSPEAIRSLIDLLGVVEGLRLINLFEMNHTDARRCKVCSRPRSAPRSIDQDSGEKGVSTR